MHEELWKQLLGLDPVDAAKRAKCEYCDDSKRFTIRFLKAEYDVDIDEKRVLMRSDEGDDADAQYLEQLCILTYLINCSDAALAGKLVTADKLEAGQFFFRGPHVLPTGKLEEVFGHDPHSIYSAATVLGAKKASYGDASIQVFVLPRLPITFVRSKSTKKAKKFHTIYYFDTSLKIILTKMILVENYTISQKYQTTLK